MGELTHDEETAAMEGLTTNAFISPLDRLQLALQVIERLHAREHERIRTAVADALRYARVNWTRNEPCAEVRTLIEDLASAEEATRSWTPEPGWCCPFCEEVECDSDCPLARVREELG
jgi:hypothetical protein